MKAALLSLLLFFQAAAPLPAQWEHWLYSRPIELPPADQTRLVRVTVPVEIYPHLQPQQADLRVIDDNGQEVPYVLYTRQRVEQRQWRTTRLEDLGHVAGQYTHAVVDVGENPDLHNSLLLETPETNFFAWVEVAASDDRRTWRVARDRAPIYRFRQDALEGSQIVTYPETRARYLRLHIRVQGGDKAFQLTGCRVAQEQIEEAERVPLPVAGAVDAAAPANQSWWRFDLGARDVPVSEARFETASAVFHRPVQVSASNDGQQWWLVGTGEIYRWQKGDQPQEKLRVEFSEVLTRYLRVAVFNRSDPPLEGLSVALYGTPRHVVFHQQPGRRYRLLYGNSAAQRPEYELARLIDSKQKEAALLGRLGSEVANPEWSDPRPWTEKHPGLVWAALGLAVVVLGGLALRSLRSST
ncbi:MAG TPA: DUF3999 family protein [Candidatus Xenobia bacterium]|nr:DUF3999 family protein [Candidatus Xenobia bacterium]